MKNDQITFDKAEFLNDLQQGVKLMAQGEGIGRMLADNQIKHLYLVGCGAPNYMFRVITYWANLLAGQTDIKTLYPAQLLLIMDNLPDKTAVIFGSHSGKTSETVQAAKRVSAAAIPTIAVTQHPDSPLAQQVRHVLAYGTTKQGYFSSLIITQFLVSAFLADTTPAWTIHETLKTSLQNLPAALADAKHSTIEKGIAHAQALQDKASLYVVAGGPMYTTAYVFSACFLMEMQRMNAHPVNTLDFFHGPFEIIDQATPLILLLGEDASRSESERVQRFCEQYAGKTIRYDARDFAMAGIHPDIRPILAPFIVDAAMTNLVEQLAILRDHPLETRRYMGKVDY